MRLGAFEQVENMQQTGGIGHKSGGHSPLRSRIVRERVCSSKAGGYEVWDNQER